MDTNDVTSLNLNIRIEILTDMSVELMEARDSMEKSRLRKAALSFKNYFFGIWYRTKAMLKRYGGFSKEIHDMDTYVKQIMSDPSTLEVFSLLDQWSVYCDMINETGITEMNLTPPLKQYAKHPGDE